MEKVVYEVNIDAPPELVQEVRGWLPGHAAAVCAAGGEGTSYVVFERGDLDEMLKESATSSSGMSPLLLTVHYTFASAAALRDYINNKSAPLRNDTIQRFGTNLTVTRRLLVPK